MPGQKRVEDARKRAYDPGIHRTESASSSGWIAGSGPAMTLNALRTRLRMWAASPSFQHGPRMLARSPSDRWWW